MSGIDAITELIDLLFLQIVNENNVGGSLLDFMWLTTKHFNISKNNII